MSLLLLRTGEPLLLRDGSGYLALEYDTQFITATDDLHKPVDYALAGEQGQRVGRLGGAALRHAFRE